MPRKIQRERSNANDANVDPYVLEERARLVQERQEELENLGSGHDDLIRQSFHMEKFTTLLTFDPEAARLDRSHVFERYKAERDPLRLYTPTVGPSRRTRRAQNEHVSVLTTTATAVASPEVDDTQQHAKPQHANDEIWGIISEAKGWKGRKRASSDVLQGSGVDGKNGVAFPTTRKAQVEENESASVARKRARPMPSAPSVQSRSSESSNKKRPAEPADTPSASKSSPSVVKTPAPRKRRKTIATSPSHPTTNGQASSSAAGNGAITAPKRLRASASLSSAPTSLSHIKRVRLIVRKPQPVYTHPEQRPFKPIHGSLAALLDSYVAVDEKNVTVEELELQAKKDARVLERARKLRRAGRLVERPEEVEGAVGDVARGIVAHEGDAWMEIVDQVTAFAKSRRPRVSGTGLTPTARAMAGYWDGLKAMEERERQAEERRVRMLAKATIRLVMDEWRKVVHHVREEERARRAEEERMRGRKHLDAILDQSGMILEAQQVDLLHTRSRSRSGSVSSVLHGWGNGPDSDDELSEPGERGSEVNEAATTVLSSDDGNDDDEFFDSQWLLQNDVSSGRRRDSSASASVSATPSELALTGSINAPPSTRSPSLDGSHITPHLSVDTMSELDSDDESDILELAPPPLSSSESTSHPSPEDPLDVIPQLGNEVQVDVRVSSPPMQTSAQRPEDEPPPEGMLNHEEAGIGNPAKSVSPSPLADVVERTEPVHETDQSPTSNGPSGDVQPSAVDADEDSDQLEEEEEKEVVAIPDEVPAYLKPYHTAPVYWDPGSKVAKPFLLRGVLRPYQQSGLEWLANLHTKSLNGILADEMGLGKTIQTIALLAHLACDRGIWGPHLIIVPTSVILNWEMEFKKFLPGFKVLSYHGNVQRRKELRRGWNSKDSFNVCVTSYTLASRDAHIFKRKPWYYMILDEAHMIKNFKSQRWNILLLFRSFRRLLLTGTPLQNNLTELWALLQFLMSGTDFANLKEFGEWFSNPLEKAIEAGQAHADETQQRVTKLHTVLRPYLLRRLKRDVEKELPSKFEHLVICPLSKRQRFLYDEFMSRRTTSVDLSSGVYHRIANILMQLRKVCNHPDLFEVRPIVTSFAMPRSALADFEIKDLLVRRRLLRSAEDYLAPNIDALGLRFIDHVNGSLLAALETRILDATDLISHEITQLQSSPPPKDMRTLVGYKLWREYQIQAAAKIRAIYYHEINRVRCRRYPLYSSELLRKVHRFYRPLLPLSATDVRSDFLNTPTIAPSMVMSYAERSHYMADIIDHFSFATPPVVAQDVPSLMLPLPEHVLSQCRNPEFDEVLHRSAVKLQIAFPDASLLQYDCGKLQKLYQLLRERKAGGHRVLIFTQMTKILDILETFLNYHGWLYLRLDGATKIEDRQYITERFNVDTRIFCFISSSRSGGVGINLTGADTVIFYDSDFNPQMDRQCEDRAHRIGQIRDVHIYRFISQHTVEEALLHKANQKRSLDDLVIQKGQFDWSSLFGDERAMNKALGEVEDADDARAAAVAMREFVDLEGVNDEEFGGIHEGAAATAEPLVDQGTVADVGEAFVTGTDELPDPNLENGDGEGEGEGEGEESGSVVDYMLAFVRADADFLGSWSA